MLYEVITPLRVALELSRDHLCRLDRILRLRLCADIDQVQQQAIFV